MPNVLPTKKIVMDADTQPLVSIILPTFNGQKYLSQSIESCLNQTYQNIELIIVDDASTDETPEIIRRYSESDSRIKIITNAKNKKLPGSLNVGHKESSGDYITWTSDDNFYLPDAIERMVSFLTIYETIGMVYCDLYYINSKGAITGEFSVGQPSDLVNGNCIGACFLYRRAVFLRTGNFSNNFVYAEDFDYWLRIATNFKIEPLHEPLYYYRFHDKSLTSTIKKNRIKKSAEKAISNNIARLPWLDKDERYLIAKKMATRSYLRHDLFQTANDIFRAIYFNPSRFFLETLTRVKRCINKDE